MYVRFFIFFLGLALAFNLVGCRGTVSSQLSYAPISVATITDPTTTEFLDEAQQTNVMIASKLQPSDLMWLTAVGANSLQTVEPIYFRARPARNQAETLNFLKARGDFQEAARAWFERLKADPPSRSDIFNAIAISVGELRRSAAPRKALIIFSDMQDNVTRVREFKASLDGIDLVVLYAFPPSRAPGEYEAYRQKIVKTFSPAKPRSVLVLFPAEARTFDVNTFLEDLRRREP